MANASMTAHTSTKQDDTHQGKRTFGSLLAVVARRLP
eukprot:SAG31_NODE_17625_length_663_cov_3.659574_1_plen_36_part_10